MHVAAPYQLCGTGCSPLGVHNLHTLWAAVFRRPLFFSESGRNGVAGIGESGAEAPWLGYSKADIWAVAACLSTELAGCSTVRSYGFQVSPVISW